MAKSNPNRRHGLDRDNDGAPGGSLKGNQTAPYEPDAPNPDAPPPAEEARLVSWPHLCAAVAVILEDKWEGWSSDSDIAGAFAAITVQLDDGDLALVEAHFAGLADDEARRNLAELTDLYEAAPETVQGFLRAAHAYAEALGADTPPDEKTATDEDTAAEETATADAEPAEETAPTDAPPAEETATDEDTAATFDAEQVQAAQDLVTAPTAAAPVAVRRRDLVALSRVRRFYCLADGTYGPTATGAGGIDQATVDAWCAAGLAVMVPSAGNRGGVRITPAGMAALRGAPAVTDGEAA